MYFPGLKAELLLTWRGAICTHLRTCIQGEQLTWFPRAFLFILYLLIGFNGTLVSRVSECLRRYSIYFPHQQEEEKYLEIFSLGWKLRWVVVTRGMLESLPTPPHEGHCLSVRGANCIPHNHPSFWMPRNTALLLTCEAIPSTDSEKLV